MNSDCVKQPVPGRQHWSRTDDPTERVKRQERQKGPKADSKTAEWQKAELTNETNQTELRQDGSAQSSSPEKNCSDQKDCSDKKDCSDEPEKQTPIICEA